MKILEVPYCFYPDAVGGTEVYVESLARELQKMGDTVVIAAPASEEKAYDHKGLPVRRFAVDPELSDLDALYGQGDPVATANFEKLLDAERPDVVHLHALTTAISPLLAARIRGRHIPLVFTYHTPTVSCPRGSLMRWGSVPCEGVLDPEICTGCVLQHLGVPRWAAEAMRWIPERVGEQAAQQGRAGGLWTALRMHGLLTKKEASFHYFMSQMDRVVAVSAWVREILLRNAVPVEKILISRHGLAEIPVRRDASRKKSEALRFVFVGRLEPIKGLDLLFRVWRERPAFKAQLDLYGIEVPGQEAYVQKLRAAAVGDSRIRFLTPLPHTDLTRTLQDYDLVVVPSQGFETGPLVVLEAYGAGVPVLGSDLGGIKEWVKDGQTGRLIEAASAEAWGDAIEKLVNDPSPIERWREQLPQPRSMRDVALEMRRVYTALMGKIHV